MSGQFSGRALTLRAPWPFAVHHLDKGAPGLGCENRMRPPPAWLVGPSAPYVALHTGAHIPTAEELRLLAGMAKRAGWTSYVPGSLDTLVPGSWTFAKGRRSATIGRKGGMISLIPGVFRILSVDAPHEGDLTGWRVPDCYGYRIDYRPLPAPLFCAGPTPKPGKDRSTNLGWWTVPAEHFATIEAACAAGASR